MQNQLNALQASKLVGIVRTNDTESAIWVASQLIEAGVRAIEIPFTVPDAVRVMETLVEQYPTAIVGAGTVLEAAQAVKALGAGAQFLVSPVLIPALVQFGKENQIFVLPGCMTPTEMYDAFSLGAPAVKFFPAQPVGGAEFIKAVKAPLPAIPIVPTGGIQREHVAAYLKAGALAVGVGGPLMPATLIQARDSNALKAHAQGFLAEAGLV